MGKHKKNVKNVEPEVSEQKLEEKKEKKEQLTCGQCMFWDTPITRDFHRNGVRPGLTECRSICRNPEAKAFRHLTMKESVKEYCVPGTFVPPAKVEETKKEEKLKQESRAATEQSKDYVAQALEMKENLDEESKGKKRRSKTKVVTNPLNGSEHVLETRKNGKA
jgi:hypothetical protein